MAEKQEYALAQVATKAALKALSEGGDNLKIFEAVRDALAAESADWLEQIKASNRLRQAAEARAQAAIEALQALVKSGENVARCWEAGWDDVPIAKISYDQARETLARLLVARA